MGDLEWKARSGYYDSLTMLANGDYLEHVAARFFNLGVDFPNYEQFWKRNIAPSSPRPQKQIGFRAGAHVALRYMSQISYSILHNFVQAKRFAISVRMRDYGFYLVNIQALLLFTGNGLQLLTELQNVIEQRLGPALPGGSINLFPDFEAAWRAPRERIVNYRNYLTHRGLMAVFYKHIAGVNVPFVLSRECLVTRGENPTAWSYLEEGFDPDSPDWVRFDDISVDILNETISYANNFYGRICDCLEPHLTSHQYQNAWGWASDLPVAP